MFSLCATELIPFQALNSDVITDSTWLPISHPDHSLGAGLGPPSEDDGEERESDDGAAETDVDGELPWTPKFNKVSRGSSFRAEPHLRNDVNLSRRTFGALVSYVLMFEAAFCLFRRIPGGLSKSSAMA